MSRYTRKYLLAIPSGLLCAVYAFMKLPRDMDEKLMSPKSDTELAGKNVRKSETQSQLYIDITPDQWPIVYRPEYNVSFMGLEKFHPFDARKWGRVFEILKENNIVNEQTVVSPNEATDEDLLLVHGKRYLESLKCSYNVAKIAEVIPLAVVPNYIVQRIFLKPLRYQTGGSVLAGKLALERGWAVNIGGGFHHCSADKGGGFCVYADISLLVRHLRLLRPACRKCMIVDLDAHQGNGHETDFLHDPDVYILDVYNIAIYPHDRAAKPAIRMNVPIRPGTGDVAYLYKVQSNLDAAFEEFTPHLIVYNAGTDVLSGDPLGALDISEKAIVTRDEIVFRKAKEKGIPIVMLTSGGYTKKSAEVIAASIINLCDRGLIRGPQ